MMKMKTAMIKLVSCTIIASMLSGCSFFQSVDELTIEEKASLLQAVSQTALSIAITEIYKKPEDRIEKATQLKTEIDKIVGGFSDPNITFDQAAEKALFDKIPPEYALYVANAINLFRAYYKTPNVGEVLGADNLLLVTSFLKGVSDGCQMVIDLNTPKP